MKIGPVYPHYCVHIRNTEVLTKYLVTRDFISELVYPCLIPHILGKNIYLRFSDAKKFDHVSQCVSAKTM